MIKIRTTQAFKNAITELHEAFTVNNNSITNIVKRALRWFKSNPFNIPELDGIGIGSPTTIRAESPYSNNETQMIVIIYAEYNLSKIQPKIDEILNQG